MTADSNKPVKLYCGLNLVFKNDLEHLSKSQSLVKVVNYKVDNPMQLGPEGLPTGVLIHNFLKV